MGGELSKTVLILLPKNRKKVISPAQKTRKRQMKIDKPEGKKNTPKA